PGFPPRKRGGLAEKRPDGGRGAAPRPPRPGCPLALWRGNAAHRAKRRRGRGPARHRRAAVPAGPARHGPLCPLRQRGAVMTKTLPLATYRIQLRGGLGFAELAGHLDYLAGLGVSHLYLSPIFAAVAGSSHG